MQNSAFKTFAIGSNNVPRLIEGFNKLKISKAHKRRARRRYK